jgi:hypothetical protein
MRNVFLALLLACSWQGASSSIRAADDAVDPVVQAVYVSLANNLLHAREWLEQKDYKSLAQTAGNLQLLAELQKSRSDDKLWQEAVGNVLSAASDVQAAAKAEDAAKCKAALDATENAMAVSIVIRPSGKPVAMTKTPGLRPLMLSMDAIFADAKVSLIGGNAPAAKKQARVVAELGKLLTNLRTTPEWSSLAADFSNAAMTAAESSENDPKLVRQQLRGISERCDACHEKSRAR